MAKIYFLTILSAGLFLVGCATKSSGPMPAGENTYIITKQEGAFPTGQKPLLAEALAEGNNFCAAQKKVFKLISSNENQGPFILFNYPKATVTFSCVAP
jgi:hypothetical protein